MLLRLLLPIVAVFALLGNAVTAFAAAGVIGDSKCCCPDPTKCKCHDHDGPKPASELKKCGGDAIKVAPHLVTMVIPESPSLVVTATARAIEHASVPVPTDHVTRPETPPF